MNQNSNHSIIRSASIVGIFSLLSRLVGLYRDRLFASSFGAGDVLDSYYASFRIPDLIFNALILGTLSVVFIPVFTDYFWKDPEEANKIANTILNVVLVGMSIISIILFFFVPQITDVIAPGFQGMKLANTIVLTKIFLLSPIIFAVASVFSSILNSFKRFFLVAFAPLVYNFGIIFGLKYLYGPFGVKGLGYGVIIGALGYMIIQGIGVYAAGFKFSWKVQLNHPGVKKIGKLFLPRVIGIDGSQISLLIASIIGSTLISGSIAVFNLANNLQAVPIGIFAISFAVASFPNLSETFAKGEHKQFNHILTKTIIDILFFVLPVSVLLLLLRAQIVRVILGTGQFDWQATRLTANTLGIFAFSIFAQSLLPLFARAFYAMQNTVIPMVVSIIAIAVNAGVSYELGIRYGVVGLALGFGISNIVAAILLYALLHSRLKHLDDPYLFYTVFKLIFCGLMLGLTTYIVLHLMVRFITLDTTLNVLLQGGVAGIAGILMYWWMSVLLGLEHSRYLVRLLKRKFLFSRE